MKKQNILISLLFSLILFSALFTTLFKVEANVDVRVKENKYAQTLSNEPTMTAGLYSEANCTDVSKVIDLTNEGAECTDGWDYDKTRYLLIDLSNLDSNKKYRVKIDMDKALYADIIELPDVSDNDYIDKIEFTKNESITYNGGNTYNLKDFSGDFVYYIAEGVSIYSITLQLRYDEVLWNKLSNSTINGYSETELLKVTFEEIEDDSTDPITTSELNSVKLLSIVTGKSELFASNVSMKQEGSSNEGQTSSITVTSDKNVEVWFFVNTPIMTLLEEFKVYIDIPTCTETGDKMIYSSHVINFSNYTIEETSDQIIITYKKILISEYITLGRVAFSFPDEYKNCTEKYTFTFDYNLSVLDNGVERKIASAFNTINIDNTTEAVLLPRFSGNSSGRRVDSENPNVVQMLGAYGIVNNGADSGEVLVSYNFDINDTNAIFVTTLRVHPDKVSKYIQVKYSLVTKNGEEVVFDKNTGEPIVNSSETPIYDSNGILLDQYTRYWYHDLLNPYYGANYALIGETSILFNRSMLHEDHRQYFFKSIEYILGEVEAGTTLFRVAAPAGYTAVGNFWGYVNEGVNLDYVKSFIYLGDVIRDTSDPSIYTIEEIENTGTEYYTYFRIVDTSTNGIKDVHLYDAKTSEEIDDGLALLAGESFILSCYGFIPNYPYDADNILNDGDKNIRLGVVLPIGASINEDSIKIVNAGGAETFELMSLTYYPLNDSTNMWIIDVEPDDGSNKSIIGYTNENLESVDNGDGIKFTFQVDTSKYTPATTMHLKEMIFFAANGITNIAAGSNIHFKEIDFYDLNNNGLTNDYVACMSSDDNVSIQIQAFNASLDISATFYSSNINSYGVPFINNSYDTEGNMISSYIQYDLSVNCLLGGSAKEFIYFIPIVKNDSIIDGELIYDNSIALELCEIPTVSNLLADSGLKILYTTSTEFEYLTYNELKKSEINKTDTTNAVEWYEDFSIVDLSDITMIKVVSLSDNIVNGSESLVSIKLSYSGDDESRKSLIDMESKFKSCGYYIYTVGSMNAGGHFGTKETSILMGYTGKEICETIVLNSENAVDEGNSVYSIKHSLYLDLNDELYFPEFNEAVMLQVKDLVLHNVNIVADISSDEDSSYANSSFYIGINTKRSSASNVRYNSLYYYLANNLLNLRTITANTPFSIEFMIEYLNKITDNYTNRYITFNLTSRKGNYVQPIKIIIDRKLTEVSDAESSIADGKFYQVFSSSDITTFISSGASVTAQFILKDFVYENYGDESINFSSPLVKNTTIMMIDCSGNKYQYYYYKYIDETITTISLSDFYKMGTNDPYQRNGEGIIDRKVLFIIDYPNENDTIKNSMQEITYLIEPSVAEVNEISNKLTYSIVDDLSYTLDVPIDSIDFENSNINITISANDILINSDLIDNSFSLILKATDDSYLPADFSVLYNSKKYTANANGEIIIPLSMNKSSLENIISLSFISETLSNDDVCKLIPSLYLSSTFDGERPKMGMLLTTGSTISITNKLIDDIALKVENMSDRALTGDELLEEVIVEYVTLNCNGIITVELEELDSYAYVHNSSGLVKVNGVLSIGDGIFNITSANGKLNILFADDLPVNKYRLTFKVFDETNTNVVYTYSYNFIVYE